MLALIAPTLCMGRTGLALRRRAHYKLALIYSISESRSTSSCTLREQLGGKKGVPAEVRINAAVGTVLKGPLNKTENRWGHSRSSFCRDDRELVEFRVANRF